jgi:hypothetical protein
LRATSSGSTGVVASSLCTGVWPCCSTEKPTVHASPARISPGGASRVMMAQPPASAAEAVASSITS